MLSSEKQGTARFFFSGTNPDPLDRIISWAEDHDFILVLLIIISCTYAYQSSFFGHFTYDDIPLILGNPFIRDWHHLPVLLEGGRPVRALTLMFDYALWGLDHRGYHLTNFLLHILASLLCFFFLKTLFQNRRLAFISAILFALHPVHTEAVMGISHRKEMLAMIFLLIAYLSYIRLGHRFPGYMLSLACYVLALLSKQVALALPFLLVAQELIMPRSENPPSGPSGLFRRLAPVIPFLLIPALAFVLVLPDFRLFSQFKPPDFADLRYPLILATSIRCFIPYLRLSFFPVHLSVDYTVPVSQSMFEPRLFLAVTAILMVGILCVSLAKSRPVLSFALVWFLINIFPVMNIIPSNVFLAERYLYIPSLGICLLLAGLFEEVIHHPKDLLSHRYQGIPEIAAVALLFFLIPLCFDNGLIDLRDIFWEDRLPFSSLDNGLMFLAVGLSTIFVIPVFLGLRRGEMKIKRALIRAGLLFAGLYLIFILDFLLSYTLANGFLTGHYTLPDINVPAYFSRWYNWVRQAAQPVSQQWYYVVESGSAFRELFNAAFLALPSQVAYCFLVILLYRKYGRENINSALISSIVIILALIMIIQVNLRSTAWGSDVGLWKATVKENPQSMIGWNNLGRAYVGRKKYDEAEQALLKAHELAPNRADILTNLGITMLKNKDPATARLYFENAVGLDPLDVNARLNLANLYAQEGDYHKAITQYYEILQIRPNSAHAHYNLAICFRELSALDKATYHALQALRISPRSAGARKLLEELQSADHSSRQ
jgi:tetratricopeptide (TPR) repeat protein